MNNPEDSQPIENNRLAIHPESGLARLPNNESSALIEIIDRSLAHIQTSKTRAALHWIGTHELCGPDYHLVCAWAEELGILPEEVLQHLLEEDSEDALPEWRTIIVGGTFESLQVDRTVLPIQEIPEVEGLVLKRLRLFYSGYGRRRGMLKLDLASVPDLTELDCNYMDLTELNLASALKLTAIQCSFNGLTELDLSQVPNLTNLKCIFNQLTKLDLSSVPNLKQLTCCSNKLTGLDLSSVPNITAIDCSENHLTDLDLSLASNLKVLFCNHNQLTDLNLSSIPSLVALRCGANQLTRLDLSTGLNLVHLVCSSNQLTNLDLSVVPNLTELYCEENRLADLDLTVVPNLINLCYDSGSTRLIKHPDQNF